MHVCKTLLSPLPPCSRSPSSSRSSGRVSCSRGQTSGATNILIATAGERDSSLLSFWRQLSKNTAKLNLDCSRFHFQLHKRHVSLVFATQTLSHSVNRGYVELNPSLTEKPENVQIEISLLSSSSPSSSSSLSCGLLQSQLAAGFRLWSLLRSLIKPGCLTLKGNAAIFLLNRDSWVCFCKVRHLYRNSGLSPLKLTSQT